MLNVSKEFRCLFSALEAAKSSNFGALNLKLHQRNCSTAKDHKRIWEKCFPFKDSLILWLGLGWILVWWVSSTPFGLLFHLPVQFSPFIICKWLLQKDFNNISASFQNLFVAVFTWKNNVAFTLISFAVLKWDYCLSVQMPFELPVQIPVQLLLELELNWLVQNVIELEFELSRM